MFWLHEHGALAGASARWDGIRWDVSRQMNEGFA